MDYKEFVSELKLRSHFIVRLIASRTLSIGGAASMQIAPEASAYEQLQYDLPDIGLPLLQELKAKVRFNRLVKLFLTDPR